MGKKEIIEKIIYGKISNLPKDMQDKLNKDSKETDYFRGIVGEEAHIIDGLKDTIEEAGFKILEKQVFLERDNKIYLHKQGDEVYYKEDIENIIKNRTIENNKIDEIEENIIGLEKISCFLNGLGYGDKNLDVDGFVSSIIKTYNYLLKQKNIIKELEFIKLEKLPNDSISEYLHSIGDIKQ